MGPLDNRPDNYGASDPRAVETTLKAVTQDLKHLQQDLILQLAQDITRLLAEKSRLSDDIDKLKMQQQQLHSQHADAIALSQTVQQQQFAQKMAETLAAQEQLVDWIEDLAAKSSASLNSRTATVGESRDRQGAGALLASMDGTLMTTYQTVQEELSGYQNTLTDKLNRLNSLQLQGNAILERLVNRTIEQLQNDPNAVHSTDKLAFDDIQSILSSNNLGKLSSQSNSGSTGVIDRPVATPPQPVSPIPPVPPVPEEPIEQPVALPPTAKKPASMVQVGLVLALISSVVLSLFNVCLKIILKNPRFPSRNILGLFEVEGFITPGFGNSLLILLLRTIVVIAVMPILATFLYPQVWQDLNRFVKSGDRDQWMKVVGSGLFLFVSQVLIYIAIGNIPAGIAITIFFIYPIVTVLASWWLFGDRPTLVRYISMGVIMGGFVLAALPSFSAPSARFGNVGLGIGAAVGAGITFAGYVLTAALGQKKLHPIPFTLVGFLSILVFCSVSLLIPLPKAMAVDFNWDLWPSLVISGALLGLLTLTSYLLNNFAIRLAGPALASIIGTSGPALTALFGFVIIQEIIKPMQIGGMVLITAAVGAMSVERLLAQKPKK